jgi:hypothetical protein
MKKSDGISEDGVGPKVDGVDALRESHEADLLSAKVGGLEAAGAEQVGVPPLDPVERRPTTLPIDAPRPAVPARKTPVSGPGVIGMNAKEGEFASAFPTGPQCRGMRHLLGGPEGPLAVVRRAAGRPLAGPAALGSPRRFSPEDAHAADRLLALAARWSTPALALGPADWPFSGNALVALENFKRRRAQGESELRAAAHAFKEAFGAAWEPPEVPTALLVPKKPSRTGG